MLPGNIGKMMKQVQKMQEDMARLQERLGDMTVEASAGGGMVTVVVTGKQVVKSLTIKPEAVDPEDVEMLQDLIIAAVNEGIRSSQQMVESEMAKVTGGLGDLKLPPGLL